MPKVNGRDFVTGAHRYTYDIRRPGMQYGKVLYPPSYGATLLSLDSAAAAAMPGVKVVREGDFVGVTAPDIETAERALAALKAEWKTAGGRNVRHGRLRAISRRPRRIRRRRACR